MATILKTVRAFLDADEWPYTEAEEGVLRSAYQGQNGQWLCFAQAREEAEQFLFYSVAPAYAAPEKFADMAEYLTRANYGLVLGNFEMDYADGEIRYRTSIDVEGASLNEAMVRSLVYANVLMMDNYLPGIMAVLFGEASPEQAIERVEGHGT